MNIIQIIILGIIQGLGEFLPISSSAHLILIPYLFNFNLNMSADFKLAFDVALHFGTLMAVLFVFYKDWINMFKGVYKKLIHKKSSKENTLFWYLVIATIPGALVGFLFEEQIEKIFRESTLIIALSLGIMGIILYISDKWAVKYYKNKEISFEKIDFKDALIVGISQAFAVIPGFSRSGTTILTGRLLGLSREAATRFTFLLSVPIIVGATIVNIPDLVISNEVILGIFISFVVGVIAIKFLLNYIKTNGYAIFAYYRVIFSIIIIIKIILN